MTPERTTYEVIFRRCWEVRFISHLDILRAISRALRRSGLDLYYTEGFNPKPKISYLSNPLAVGHTSECERLRFKLTVRVEADKAGEQLFAQLPRGLSPDKITLVATENNESLSQPPDKLEYLILKRTGGNGSSGSGHMDNVRGMLSESPETSGLFTRDITREDIESVRMFAAETGDCTINGGLSRRFISEYYSGGFVLRIPAGSGYRRPEKWLQAAGVEGVESIHSHRKRELV